MDNIKLRDKAQWLTQDYLKENIGDKLKEIAGVVKQLEEYMRKNPTAAGMSSIQIGSKLPVFVWRNELAIENCINPQIVEFSNKRLMQKERCMSFPGISVVTYRDIRIKVHYLHLTYKNEWKRNHLTLVKEKAQIFQHEVDHLFGVVMLDNAIPIKEKVIGRDRMVCRVKVEKPYNFDYYLEDEEYTMFGKQPVKDFEKQGKVYVGVKDK